MALEVAVVPSLDKLLKYEWGLDKTMKHGLWNLKGELTSMHTFLGVVSGMPQVKLRAREITELSYAIEARLHSFVARIESTKGALVPAVSKRKIIHEMASYIKETQIKVKEVLQRYPCKSYLESISAQKVESNPVGIDGAVDKLINKLSKGDHVSIVGMGGMGKTTLARAVYDKTKGDFDCGAFVPIGQRAEPEKVLKDIFHLLHIEIHGHAPDTRQLTNKLRNFLVDKRCLFVMDDIWDKETCYLVQRVFKGSVGSKIITTTRNLNIPKGVGGAVYTMKPLSPADSKELLRTKAEVKSHDAEFDTLSDKILRICGGVPIAITVIGSWLGKNRNKEWHRVYDSIGFDEHKEDEPLEHVRKVFSYSYYALPYNIKKCFLYLSLFPEDHWIEKNMLIWRWVAEGLVPDGLFETGETYFNELLDRSMIQWAVSPRDLSQGGCRVHTLMLDLIRFLSSSDEENFSTVLGMKQESTSQTGPIYRLAIHETIVGWNENTSLEVGEVLSFYAGMCTASSFPALQRFKRLRVIDLEACDLSVGDCKLKQLRKLKGLKYVGLVGTPIAELPREIGGLELLQMLDVTATGIRELPPFVGELRKLRCLRAGKGTRMMGRVGGLMSVEELCLHSADKSPAFAAELRKLREIRVLVIHFDEMDEGMQEALVVSLHKLKKLQVLQVWSDEEEKVRLGSWEGSVPSRQLHQLLLIGVILPRPMPWIHHSRVPKLSKLLLQVETLKVQHLQILGQMPLLRSLYIHSEEDKYRLSYTTGKNEFKVLEYLNTNIELICGDAALPVIQGLEVGGIRVGVDVGLRGNMPLLERASYHLDCRGCGPVEVQKAEEALRQASQGHPNSPVLTIKRWNDDFAGGVPPIRSDGRGQADVDPCNKVPSCSDSECERQVKGLIYTSKGTATGEMLPCAEGMQPTGLTMGLLEKITDNFSEERVLGQGGYGKVYRGVRDDGQEIAVKLLYNNTQTIDDKQFKHEFENLMVLKHPNIVRLVGYCYETQHQRMEFEGKYVFGEITYKALCFEYMAKGSLQKHLLDEYNGRDWQTRYKIIKGTCEGLKYLHEGFKEPFYHLDLKPDNILLDEDMTPKLADFGLSKFYDGEQTCRVTQSHIAGTIGYMAPEYINENKVSKKLDIFSLGVVMAKIIAGPSGCTRCAEIQHQEFLDQVEGNWRKRLQRTGSSPELLEAQCRQVKICTEIALSCMKTDRHKRPSIVDIINKLDETETSIEKVTNCAQDPSPLASNSNIVQPVASPPPSTQSPPPSPTPSAIPTFSNVLMLDHDEIDITWNAKDQFPENSKAEVAGVGEEDDLPVESSARVQEMFGNTD